MKMLDMTKRASEKVKHLRGTYWHLLVQAGVVASISCGAIVAAAQPDTPAVPGRGTSVPAYTEVPPDSVDMQRPKLPPVFHGVDGRRPPTTGKVLWKGSAPDWEAKALLFRMRDSNDPEARARALEMLPLDEARASDLERLFYAAQDPQPSVQQAAWTSLDRCAEKELFAYVIRTLAWGTEDRVRPLDASLPKLGPRLEKMMTATLETELEAARHRRAAAYCLGRSGAQTAAPLLAKHALAGQGDLAETCAVALSMLRAPSALHDWETMLSHQDTTIQSVAVRALADLDTAPARRALFETAAGKRQAGRAAEQEAARMVGRWPDSESIPALIDIMRANTPLNTLAGRLLHDKTGQNLGASAEAWDHWLQQGGQKRGPAAQLEIKNEQQVVGEQQN